MKKLLSILLVLVMAACAAGCSLTATNTPASTATPADPSATAAPASTDGAAADAADMAVATVGEEKLTFGEFKQTFEMYQQMFLSYYGYDIAGDAATLSQYQDDILDMLVEQLIIKNKVKENNIGTYTAEQQAELDARIQDELTSLDEYYRATAEQEAAADSTVDVEARIKELIAAEAESYSGKAMTYEEYIEFMKQTITDTFNQDLLKRMLTADLTADDADVQKLYDEYLASDTTTYTDAPGSYRDDQEAFETSVGARACLYVPEGYSRVYHILFAPEGEMPAEYQTYKTEAQGYEDELCDLLLTDAMSGNGANADRISELLELYKTALNNAQTVSDTFMADAKARADAAYAKLEAGTDFAAVMNEGNDDIDFTAYPALAEKGKLINATETSVSDWSETVKAYFAELQLGQYSTVFSDDEGYHIIKYVSDETAGNRSIDEVRDALSEEALRTKQDTEWESILDTWRNDGSVVLNEALYKTVGVVG